MNHPNSTAAASAAAPRGVSRRNLLALSAALVASGGAWAQAAFPSKTIQVVIPTPPGSGADILARLLLEPLRARLGQTLFVESKSGASGTLAAGFVARAAPDGYTLLLTYGIQALAPIAYKKLTYKPFADFAPVCQIARVPLVAVVPVSLPVKTLKEFVELARSSPGRMNYASTGKGALNQFLAESLKLDTKIDLTHVPYKGGGPAMQAVMTGEAQIYFSSYAGVKGLVDGGKLRIIAITGASRSPDLPQVPTARESGFPGIEAYDWYGILAPAATPPAAIAALNRAVVASVMAPDVHAKLVELGYEIVGGTPAEFDALIKADNSRWTARAAHAGITFEE